MTTSGCQRGMPLVVAVAMKCHQVARVIASTQGARKDVVDFDDIFITKAQSTGSTRPLLFTQQFA
jgi:hypothetical protein